MATTDFLTQCPSVPGSEQPHQPHNILGPHTAPDTHSPAVAAAPAGPSWMSPALPGSPSAAHSPWHKGCDNTFVCLCSAAKLLLLNRGFIWGTRVHKHIEKKKK